MSLCQSVHRVLGWNVGSCRGSGPALWLLRNGVSLTTAARKTVGVASGERHGRFHIVAEWVVGSSPPGRADARPPAATSNAAPPKDCPNTTSTAVSKRTKLMTATGHLTGHTRAVSRGRQQSHNKSHNTSRAHPHTAVDRVVRLWSGGRKASDSHAVCRTRPSTAARLGQRRLRRDAGAPCRRHGEVHTAPPADRYQHPWRQRSHTVYAASHASQTTGWAFLCRAKPRASPASTGATGTGRRDALGARRPSPGQ